MNTPINIIELNKYILFINEFQSKNKYCPENIKSYNEKFKEANNIFVKENFTNIDDQNFYTVTL